MLYLRNVMEVPHGTPIAALYLELGIISIQFEIEKRQLLFLRRISNKDLDDPLQLVCNEQLKYEFEKNWANYMSGMKMWSTYQWNSEKHLWTMSLERKRLPETLRQQ